MPVIQRLTALVSCMLLALTLAACVKEKPTLLEGSVSASADVNPDGDGTASPVVVRYYELKSTKAFDSAGFFDIYDEATTTLAGDMLHWGEVELVPGGSQALNLEVTPGANFVGFLVAYRDIENASWRGKMALKPNSVNEVVVNVGKLAVDVAAP